VSASGTFAGARSTTVPRLWSLSAAVVGCVLPSSRSGLCDHIGIEMRSALKVAQGRTRRSAATALASTSGDEQPLQKASRPLKSRRRAEGVPVGRPQLLEERQEPFDVGVDVLASQYALARLEPHGLRRPVDEFVPDEHDGLYA